MIFLITYSDTIGLHHELEWITDGDGSWTVESITRCFRRRYPAATLLSCSPALSLV